MIKTLTLTCFKSYTASLEQLKSMIDLNINPKENNTHEGEKRRDSPMSS